MYSFSLSAVFSHKNGLGYQRVDAFNLKCAVALPKHMFSFAGGQEFFQFIFHGLKTFSIVYHKLTPNGKNLWRLSPEKRSLLWFLRQSK